MWYFLRIAHRNLIFLYFGAGCIFNFFLQFNQSSDFQVCIYLLNWTFGSICSFPDAEVSWGVWKYFHRDLKNGKNIFTPGVCSVGSFTDCLEKLSQSQILFGYACLPQHITVSNLFTCTKRREFNLTWLSCGSLFLLINMHYASD